MSRRHFAQGEGGELTLLLLCELLVDLDVFVGTFVGECVVGLVEELAHCDTGTARGRGGGGGGARVSSAHAHARAGPKGCGRAFGLTETLKLEKARGPARQRVCVCVGGPHESAASGCWLQAAAASHAQQLARSGRATDAQWRPGQARRDTHRGKRCDWDDDGTDSLHSTPS